MLRPHQRRALRTFLPHQSHRVRNHLLPSLQRHIRNHLDRCRMTPQQKRFGQFGMLIHTRFAKLPGDVIQPPACALGLDALQHFRAHAYRHAHPGGGETQQQIDQYLGADFPQQFVHVRRRQHPHPTDQHRQIDEQQRFITQHQQAFGDGFGTGFKQRFKLKLRQVMQQLFGMYQRC